MGFYTRFKDSAARAEIVRYYHFIEQHDAIFRGARPHAEATLLYPRNAVHAGEMAEVEKFKTLGRRLLDEHRLFAVLPDDIAVPDHLKATRVIKGEAVEDETRSRFEAPKTVRVSASQPAAGGSLHLHFVNYNRDEPAKPKSPGSGIQDEKPIATPVIACDVRLPSGFSKPRVVVFTPESTAHAC
jgi:hypothetical protein